MTVFDDTTNLAPVDDGHATINLDERWSSLSGVHGGYLAAIAVRAAGPRAGGRPVRTLTTTFLRRAVPGPASTTVRALRTARSISTFEVELTQESRAVATTRLTCVAAEPKASWETPQAPALPAFADCIPVTPPEHVRHFTQATARIDPAFIPFTGGATARVAGYVQPLEDRPPDAAWLAMVMDWFPPAAFTRIDPTTGGVSVDYTVHLHRPDPQLAPGSWLAGEFQTDVSVDGLALEHGTLRDPDGHLVAEAFHTRWTGA